MTCALPQRSANSLYGSATGHACKQVQRSTMQALTCLEWGCELLQPLKSHSIALHQGLLGAICKCASHSCALRQQSTPTCQRLALLVNYTLCISSACVCCCGLGRYLVVYILDEPECNGLHWVALLLKLCQQVYVSCACGMQWATYDQTPLLELFLQRQCLHLDL